jgi:hypothetical protein
MAIRDKCGDPEWAGTCHIEGVLDHVKQPAGATLKDER